VRVDKNRRNVLIYNITLTQNRKKFCQYIMQSKWGKKDEMGEKAYEEYIMKK